MAQNGLTIKYLNQLIFEETSYDANLIIIAIGGNDVFSLTTPWVWVKHLENYVKYFQKNGESPIIIFSAVPCVGMFPAIPNSLRFVFGCWKLLLQKSLKNFVDSEEAVYLLRERFPSGKKYFMEDGIHPSKLAYKLWSEKLAVLSFQLINIKANS